MISELLTIVIPTRNRPDLLELCLRSVFDCQEAVPSVIVSDNSTSDLDAVQTLRERYGFSYIRQSGKLSMIDHHNACLKLVSRPWVLLLHDDDELYPNILTNLEPLLAECSDAGVVVGGIQFINQDGTPHGVWVPDFAGIFRGENVVLRLGLDYRVCPPGIIWNVSACHEAGGFPNSNGTANEQVLLLRLAYSPGVVVLREIIGRYRIWPDQTTNYSTPNGAEYILDCTIEGAKLAHTIGVSASTTAQLADYMIWWVFRFIIPLFSKHPFFVSRLCRKCETASPPNGAWRSRVKGEHPYLFWKPRRLSILFFLSVMTFVPRCVRRPLRIYSLALFRGFRSLPEYFYRFVH
jgi:glycosyltransferase involved in cell wall biosynthesis